MGDRQVLLFSCLDPQFSAARRGTGATGGILYVPIDSPTGPFDIAAASPLLRAWAASRRLIAPADRTAASRSTISASCTWT